ncbi:MAG TPA: DUF4097 family beta strand repeat-containing protein [Phycisphaerae bacterium]|nr:DUF4097 family beta strand repeat-containing protein [Phycisphaerae bacterium]
MRRWVGLSLFVVTTTALVGCGSIVRVSRDFSFTAPWEDYQRVVVNTHNGRVELAATGTSEIDISGTKRAGGLTYAEAEENLDQVTIVAEPDAADPTTFRISVDYPAHLRGKSIAASFVIHVPEPCAAEIATGNGSIRAENLRDQVVLRTSNGRITLSDIAGNVRVRTSNGRVEAERIDGELYVDTGNGSVSVRALEGVCELETSNGAVEAVDVRGDISVTTSNGRIRVEAAPPEDASVILRTSNGSIHVTLPATMRGDLTLSTSNGRVSTSMDQVSLTSPSWSRRRFEAVMNGGGGGRIVARSSNGSITFICR